MDHTFQGVSSDLKVADECLQKVADMQVFRLLTRDDWSLVISRKDAEVKADATRDVLTKNAFRLGVLAKDVVTACKHLEIDVHGDVCKQWNSLLNNGPSSEDLIGNTLDALHASLKTKKNELQKIEWDDGSSTESDYSDSMSVSTDEDEDQ